MSLSISNYPNLQLNYNPAGNKNYTLARKVIEAIALIFANLFTLGLINLIPAVRREYKPVFCSSQNYPEIIYQAPFTQVSAGTNGVVLKAPFTELKLGMDGIHLKAPGTNVDVSPTGIGISVLGYKLIQLGNPI